MTSYLAQETSVSAAAPVELYEFNYQNVFMRYTSGAAPVVYGSNTFAPYAVSRNAIQAQAATNDQNLEVTAFQDFPPAQLFRVQAPSTVVNLVLRREHLTDTTSQFITLWIGRILSVKWEEGSKVQLLCESDLVSLKRLSLRRRYQLACPYTLYGVGCNLAADSFAIPVTTWAVAARALTVPALAAYAVNYFAGGYISYYSTLTQINEIISIRQSAAGVLQLALTPYGIETATAMNVYPGCNHTTVVCNGTFNNLDNYGGQPYIPGTNPFAGVQLF